MEKTSTPTTHSRFIKVKVCYNESVHEFQIHPRTTARQMAADFVKKNNIITYGNKVKFIRSDTESSLDDDEIIAEIPNIENITLQMMILDVLASMNLNEILDELVNMNNYVAKSEVNEICKKSTRCRLEGFIYLKKKSRMKMRYMVLEKGVLHYAKAVTQKTYDFKKRNLLNVMTKDSRSLLSENKKKGYIIGLKLEQKTLYLASITEETMNIWKEELIKCTRNEEHQALTGRMYWFANNKWELYFCRLESNTLEISSFIKQEYFNLYSSVVEKACEPSLKMVLKNLSGASIGIYFENKNEYRKWSCAISKEINLFNEKNKDKNMTLKQSNYLHKIREIMYDDHKLLERDRKKLKEFERFKNVNDKKYFILSMEGGGCRGLMSIILLERIVKAFPDLLDRVHLIAGTSVGSLFGSLLVTGHHPTTGRKFLQSLAKDIFTKSKKARLGINEAKYCNNNLVTLAKEVLGDVKFKDLEKKFLVPALLLDNKHDEALQRKTELSVFHNFTSEYEDMLLYDAILASSAAPTFFPGYNGYLDGGVVSNSAADLAVVHAMKHLGVKLEDIVVLSIGTGTPVRYYQCEDGKYDWGIAQWLPKMINLLWENTIFKTDYVCGTLLNENYHKISPLMEIETPIDDPSHFPLFMKKAKEYDLIDTTYWLKEKLKIHYNPLVLKKNGLKSNASYNITIPDNIVWDAENNKDSEPFGLDLMKPQSKSTKHINLAGKLKSRFSKKLTHKRNKSK